MKKLEQYAKYVSTPEEWHPCYPGQRVEVRLSERPAGIGGGWSVGVSGLDDTGASNTFPDLETAQRIYISISDGITMAECIKLGLEKW